MFIIPESYKPEHLTKLKSFKAHRLLNEPDVINADKGNIKVNREYSVPFLAGASKDGKTVYIDKHFNPKMPDGKNVIPALIRHELVEFVLMTKYKLKYPEAHKLATHEEYQKLHELGIDLHAYDKFLSTPIKTSEAEREGKAPPDLYMKPYEEESSSKDGTINNCKACHNYRKLGIK